MNSAASTDLIYPGHLQREIYSAHDHRQLYDNGVFCSRFIEHVHALVEQHNITALSFDVFDTALLRTPHCELKRFQESAIRFAAMCERSATDVLVARLLAARGAYSMSAPAIDGTREGTLDAISHIACDLLNCSRSSDQFSKNELKVERGQLSPNPLVQQLIKGHPTLKVVFVSDMYLSSANITALLKPHYGKEISVFSSADGYGSKRNGGLYDYVAKTAGLTPQRSLHFGDSLHSDLRQARMRGWRSMYMPLPAAEIARRREDFSEITSSLTTAGINVSSYVQFNM